MMKNMRLTVALTLLSLVFVCGAALAAADTADKKLPTVHILATGGTIAGSASSATNLTTYKAGSLSVEQLMDAVPALKEHANIKAEQVASISSNNMSFDVWLKLAKRINALLAEKDVDGVVITHGTDTIEETAYFLNLVVKSKKPVVLVGSMRPATAISADGPLNLLNAVALAGSKEAQGKGVLVVLNGQINAAREVTKTNTLNPDTFKSGELGFLGYVVNFKPVFYRESTRKHTADTVFDLSKVEELPRVDIFYNDVNTAPDMLKASIASGAKGIINAGTGNGSMFKPNQEILTAASKDKGILVVRTARFGSGMVTQQDYDHDSKFVRGDNLLPQKARILLMVALTKTQNFEEIQSYFDQY